MGAQSSTPLKFIQIVEDPKFGSIRVYREEEQPYRYYMKLSINVSTQSKASERQIQTIVGVIRQHQSQQLFPRLLHPTQVSENCGIRTHTLTLQYQNHTLRDFCLGLKERQDYLQIGQICYVVDTALQIGRIANKNCTQVRVSPDELFVTTQGMLMVYPEQLQQGLSKQVKEGCLATYLEMGQHKKSSHRKGTFFETLAETLRLISKRSPIAAEMDTLANKIYVCQTVESAQKLYGWKTMSTGYLELPMSRNSPFAKRMQQSNRNSSWSGSTNTSFRR